MTLDDFYNKYIFPAILKERPGIKQDSKDHFIKSNKIIRKIKSQFTYNY